MLQDALYKLRRHLSGSSITSEVRIKLPVASTLCSYGKDIRVVEVETPFSCLVHLCVYVVCNGARVPEFVPFACFHFTVPVNVDAENCCLPRNTLDYGILILC